MKIMNTCILSKQSQGRKKNRSPIALDKCILLLDREIMEVQVKLTLALKTSMYWPTGQLDSGTDTGLISTAIHMWIRHY